MAALLVATTGVSVQQIYCYCIGETTLGLFTADDACQGSKQAAENLPDCCAKATNNAPSCCGENASKEHDCTKKTTRFFQLKTEFLTEKWSEKEFHPDWIVNIQHLDFQVFDINPAAQKLIFPQFPQPPPPSGRMICVRHCIARC
jgi:hypothetical protein